MEKTKEDSKNFNNYVPAHEHVIDTNGFKYPEMDTETSLMKEILYVKFLIENIGLRLHLPIRKEYAEFYKAHCEHSLNKLSEVISELSKIESTITNDDNECFSNCYYFRHTINGCECNLIKDPNDKKIFSDDNVINRTTPDLCPKRNKI